MTAFRYKRLLWTAVLTASLAGCGPQVELPPPEPAKVIVAEPVRAKVIDYDEYTGRLQAVETVDVRARASGYLQEVNFTDGDDVKAGDVLFVIDPSTYEAAAEQAVAQIAVWKAKYEFADATMRRNEPLRKSGAISLEEFESSVASRNEALAAKTSAEADLKAKQIELGFTTVKSDINGRIDRTYVTKGNLVQTGPGEPTLLTRIVSVDPIYVYFDCDELALLKYTENRLRAEAGQPPVPLREKGIKVQIEMADGAIYSEKGTVDFASNEVDPTTGTISVRATVPNAAGALIPGLFVRVRVAPDKAYEAVLVVERAILTDQSEKYVYVLNEKNEVERRNVTLGSRQGALRVVTAGLTGTERVVIEGLQQVRPGVPTNPTEGAMPEPPPVDPELEAGNSSSPGGTSPNGTSPGAAAPGSARKLPQDER